MAQTTTERAPRGVYTNQFSANGQTSSVYIEVDNMNPQLQGLL
jgi:hypothetical protein